MDLTTLALMGALIVGGYFLLIRPQQRRAKQQKEQLEQQGVGSRVVISGGVYGTIRHLGDKQAIVEVSPGVELTIMRQAIIRPVRDDEDEFEYADDEDGYDPYPASDDTSSSKDTSGADSPSAAAGDSSSDDSNADDSNTDADDTTNDSDPKAPKAGSGDKKK